MTLTLEGDKEPWNKAEPKAESAVVRKETDMGTRADVQCIQSNRADAVPELKLLETVEIYLEQSNLDAQQRIPHEM